MTRAPSSTGRARSENADATTADEVSRLLHELHPHIAESAVRCFIHNGLHEMNVGRSQRGDAGCGEPTLDFAVVTFLRLPAALARYDENDVKRSGDEAEVRSIWDRLHNAIKDATERAANQVPVGQYRRFFDSVA